MKAIVQDRYGGPEVLELRDIDQPVPTDNEVLVQVHAAGLHRGDWHVMTGLPYMIRLAVPSLGLGKPKVPVLGRGGHHRHWGPPDTVAAAAGPHPQRDTGHCRR